MPHEYSVGVVVFHGDEFLLLHYSAGHWGFPKGRPHTGEPKEDAARREVKEETGIEGLYLIKEFVKKEEYFFKRDGKTVHKEVQYFLGETSVNEVKLSEEHLEYKWLKYEEAMGLLSFPESKEILKEANEYLKRH